MPITNPPAQGPSGAIQYKGDTGSTAGDGDLTWNSTSNEMTSSSIISGDVIITNREITNLNTLLVTTDSHASTKSYVDSVAAGLVWREPADATSTEAITSTWPPGNANPPVTELDGYTLTTGDRVLIKNQTNEKQNGFWDVENTTGWTRSADLAEGFNAKSVALLIINGDTQKDFQFVCNSVGDPVTVGNATGSTGDDITFVNFSKGEFLVAGAGLTKTGNVLAAVVDDVSIIIDVDTIKVKDAGITTDKIAADAINNSKIANNAVQNENILDGAIYGDKLLTNAVTIGKINDGAVTNDKLAGSISNNKLVNDSVIITTSGGSGLLGGGEVDLGDSLALTIDDTIVLKTTGGQTITGIDTFDNTENSISFDSGAIRITQGGLGVKQDIFSDGKVTATTLSDGTAELSSGILTGLNTPSNASDAANKSYVDNLAIGLQWLDPCRAATTSATTDLPLTGSIANMDGVTNLITGDRALVKNQDSNQISNGLYTVNTAGTWSRVADLPNGADANNASVYIEEGGDNIGVSFTNTTNPAIVNVNSLDFVKFSGNVQLNAGIAMTKVGNDLNVNFDNITIGLTGNDLQVKNSSIGTSQIIGLSVTNDKLNGSISNDKLAGGITNDKLNGSISNDKLAGGITNDKLAGSIANTKLVNSDITINTNVGSGLTGGTAVALGGNTALQVVVDDASIEIATNTIGVKDGGISNAKLAGSIANNKLTNSDVTLNTNVGSGLTGGATVALGGNTALQVIVDTTSIEIATNTIRVKDDGITTAKILDANVTNAKLANDSVTVTAGDGLQTGGAVALGAAVTLDVDATVVRTTGDQDIAGVKTFTDTTQSISGDSGAVLIDGGLGVIKNITSDAIVKGATLTDGTSSLSAGALTNLTATINDPKQAATKEYVDGLITGLSWLDPVKVATTVDIPNLNNVTIIDGVSSFSDGDRVLIKNQTSAIDNGIYVIGGSPSPFTLSRASDMSSGSATNAATFVEEGSENISSSYVVTSSPATVGSTAIDFTKFAGSATINAGEGLSKDGTTLNVNVDDSSIEINSDTLRVKAGGITNTMLVGSIANAKLVNSDVTLNTNVGSGLTGGASVALGGNTAFQVVVDNSTVEIATNTIRVKDDGITTAKILDASVTNDKLVNSDVILNTNVGSGLTGGAAVALGGNTAFQVVVDNSTVEIATNTIRVKDDGITTAKILDANVTNAKLANNDVTVTAGAGLIGGGSVVLGSSINLDVNVDNSSIEIDTDTLRVKDGGITNAKLAGSIANAKLVNSDVTLNTNVGSGLTGGASVALGGNTAFQVVVDNSTVEIATNTIRVKDDGITTAKILDANVTNAKLANNSVTVTAGDGLQTGGAVALGAAVTLDVNATVVRTTGDQDIAGVKTFSDTTQSSSSSSGAIITYGGLGVAKNITSAATIEGSTLTDGFSSLSAGALTNLTATINDPKQAATKEYVDGLITGISWLDPVKVATIEDISNLNDVTTIDGVSSFSDGDRVLVKNQTSTIDNGIYVIGGSPSPFTLSRASDMSSGSATNAATFVEEGLINISSSYVVTSSPATVGSTAIDFTKFSGSSVITAGEGLTKIGNELEVNVDNSSIEINSDTLRVKAGGIVNAMLTGSITNAKLVNSDITLNTNVGSGLTGGASVALGGNTAFQVVVDDDTVEIATNTIRVKDDGITNAKLAGSISNAKLVNSDVTLNTNVGSGLTGGASVALGGNTAFQVVVDNSTVEIATNTIRVKDDGITTAKILDANVTNAKLANNDVTVTAGAGLIGGGSVVLGSSINLDINVDDVTIEIDADTLRVKDGGITNAKLAGSIANAKLVNSDVTLNTNVGSGLTGGASVALGGNTAFQVVVDNSTVEIATNTIRVKDDGITTAKILDANVTNAKLANNTVTVTAGDGLQTGGAVALGAAVTLDVNATVVRTSGIQNIEGVKTFADTTQSSSSGTGAVVISGGLGVIKNITSDAIVKGATLTDGLSSLSAGALTNLTAAINDPKQAATKEYVDGISTGLIWKDPVKVTTTADIPVLNNVTIIDGVSTFSDGDRVLVKNQTSTIDNGIYVIGDSPSPYTLSRASDMLPATDAANAAVFIEEGSTYSNIGFVCNSNPAIVDTDPLTFVQFAGNTIINAGSGLSKIGNDLSVNVDDSSIEIDSDTLRVKDDGITTAKILDANVTNAKLANNDVTVTAGAGLIGGGSVVLGSSINLDVNVDNSSIEIDTDTLRVKDGGITNANLAGSIANAKLVNSDVTLNTDVGSGLTGGASVALGGNTTFQVVVDNSTVEIATNTIRVKDDGITTAKILDANVTNAKLANNDVTVTAGAGLIGGGSVVLGSSINLDVNVDNSSIEIDTDTLRVKDGGITNAKLAGSIANAKLVNSDVTLNTNVGSGLTGGASVALGGNTALQVVVDNSTVEIATNTIRVKDDGITTAKILDANVTNSKLANNSVTVTAGDGLQTGGTVALGAAITLDVNATVVRTSGIQDIAGVKTFTDTTQSISGDSGAVLIDGGLGVIKNITSDAIVKGVTLTDGISSLSAGALTNLTAAITGDKQAATKEYVDNAAVGTQWKDPVKVATTADIPVLNNVTIIDGVSSFSDGDRVLVKNQTSTIDNGIYVIGDSPSPYTLSRASDMLMGTNAANAATFVEEGLLNISSSYVVTSEPAVVGTNNLDWVKFAGAATVTAGNGLTKEGLELSVNVDNSSIQISSDILGIKAGGITNAMLAGSIANAKLANNDVTVTAGAGLIGGGSVVLGSSINLDVNVDNSSIEIDTDTLRVKDGGITNAKLAGSIANAKLVNSDVTLNTNVGSGLTGGASVALGGNTALQVVVDNSTVEIATNTIRVKDDGITTAKILDANVTNAKLANNTVTVTAGDGLIGGGAVVLGSSINLDVNVDNSSIEIDTDTLRVKDGGITNAKLAGSIANAKLVNSDVTLNTNVGSGLTGGASVALGGNTTFQVVVDNSTVEIATNTIRVKDDGITTAKILDANVTNAKLANNDVTVTAGAGLIGGGSVVLGSSINLDINVDNSSIEIDTDTLRVKDGGITNAKLAGSIANAKLVNSDVTLNTNVGSGLTGGASVALGGNTAFQVVVDNSTVEIATNTIRVKDDGITTAKILDANVTNAKLANNDVTVTAGAGLIGGGSVVLGSSINLDINVDNSSIEIDTDTLRVKDGGITNAKLAGSIANAKLVNSDVTLNTNVGSGLTGGASVALGGNTAFQVVVDNSTVEIATNTIRVKDDGITTAKILDANVTNAKLANNSVTVTAGDGLQTGGAVALGAAVTLDVNATVVRTSGIQNIAGVKTFTDTTQSSSGDSGAVLIDGGLGVIKNITSDAIVKGATLTDGLSSLSAGALTNLTAAINDPKQAATKEYVDGISTGLIWKDPVKVTTTADIPVLNNVTIIDGVSSFSDGDRVLVKNQTSTIDNGIYVIGDSPSPYTLSRASDMLPATDAANAAVFIEEGSTYSNIGFVCNSNPAIVDTDPLTFVQFAGNTIINAGSGLSKIGNDLSVNVDDTSIEIDSDTLRVKAGGITNAMLTGSIANAKLANNNVTVTAGAGLIGGGEVTLGGSTNLDINVDDVTIEIDTDTLKVKDGGITNAKLAGSIANAKLVNSDVTLNTNVGSGLTGGASVALGGNTTFQVVVDNSTVEIATNTIRVKDDGITTAKILDANVTNAKLANNDVTVTAGAGLIGGGSVVLGSSINLDVNVDNSSIEIDTDTLRVKDGGITNAKLAGSIANAKLVNSDVTLNTNVGSGLTGGASVALGGNTTFQVVVDNSTVEIATNTIRVKDDGITTAKILDANVTNAKLANNDVTVTAGAGLIGGGSVVLGSSINLDINVDNSSIEIDTDTLRVKDGGITNAKLAGSIANAKLVNSDVTLNTNVGSGLTGGASVALGGNTALQVVVDNSTVEIATNTIRVKDDGITTAKILDANVTNAKLANNDVTVTAGAGLIGGGSVVLGSSINLDINVDNSSIEIDTDTLRVKDGGITNAKLAGSIANAKLVNSDVTLNTNVGSGLTGGASVALGGNTAFQVVVDNSTVEIATNTIRVKDDGITTAKILDANVTNAKLANNSVTVTAGDGLQTGGAVALGAAVTLDVNATVVRTSGIQNIAGVKTFTDTTQSISGDSGAVLIDGGLGVIKNITSDAIVKGTTLTDGISSLSAGALTNLTATITDDKQAATKEYVDNAAVGTQWKDPVKVATTADIPVLNNVTIIDGVSSFSDGDRVLVKNQTSAIDNGIYVIGDSPSPYTLSRASDMLIGTNAANAATFVEEGSVNISSSYVVTSEPAVVGTNNLDWVKFAGAATITAGDGLSKIGQELSVNVDNSSIEIDSDILGIKAGGITNAMLAGSIANAKLANNNVTVTAGAGLIGGGEVTLGGSTNLDINVDDVTIEIDTDTLRVKDGGITNAKLAGSIANAKLVNSDVTLNTNVGSGLTGGASVALGGNTAFQVVVDNSTVEIATNTIRVKDDGITTDKILDANVTNAKLANNSVTVTAGDGLQTGGAVALGAAVTLDVDNTVVRTTGAQTISGIKSFDEDINATNKNTGAVVLTAGGLGVELDIFAGGTITGTSITDGTATLNSGTLTGLVTPTSDSEAANKAYVDSVASGLYWKDPVKVATTINIDLVNTGLAAIDGITLLVNDRVLVKNQSSLTQNGIYLAQNGTWVNSRSADYADGDSVGGSSIWINEGSTQGDSAWVCTNDPPNDIVDTDPLTFVQFSGAGQITAGDGLTKNGNVLSVNVDNSTIEISTDTLQVKALGITDTELASDSVITSKILNDAVTTAKILDANVTNAKMATDSVGTSNIINANVTNAKMATDSVGTSNIINANVTNAKMATDSVNTVNIINDAVTTAKILDANVTNAKMATDSVGTSNIINANVTNAKMATDSVGTSNIINANVTNAKMATDSVGTSNIINANVTNAKMATDSVGTSNIINANVTNAKMATDSVNTVNIINDAVTTAKILNANVTNAKLANDSITVTGGDGINSIGSPVVLGGTVTVDVDNTVVRTTGAQTISGNKTFSNIVQTDTSFVMKDPAGSNLITMQAPTLIGDYTLTFPVNDGDASQVLTTDGAGVLSWSTTATSNPGAPVNSIQFNSAGSFGGSTDFLWDNSSKLFTVQGTEVINLAAKSGTPSLSGSLLDIKAQTYDDDNTAGSGTATAKVFNSIEQPTLTATNTSVTTTDAATVYIAGAPIASTNQTIANAYSLWVDTGAVKVDDILEAGTLTDGSASLTSGALSGVSTLGMSGNLTIGGDITRSSGLLTISSGDDNVQVESVTFNGGAVSNVTTLTATGAIRSNTSLILEDPAGGTNTVTIQSGVPISSYTLTLPVNDGETDQFLQTNGSGVLAWADAESSGYTRTDVNSVGPYTVLAGDEFLGVTYTATGSITLNLPQISGLGLKRYYIVDEGGNAGTNNITISAFAGDTINGNATRVINANYNTISLYNNGGTGWFIF